MKKGRNSSRKCVNALRLANIQMNTTEHRRDVAVSVGVIILLVVFCFVLKCYDELKKCYDRRDVAALLLLVALI
jgi:hypothetical protein